MEQQVLAWIAQYGYLAIFSLLVLGIVGLPVPDETLLTFTGYLVFQGHLALPLAFLSGWAGSACGITLSWPRGLNGATGTRLDRAVRVPGDFLPAGAGYRRPAGSRRDPADVHRIPGVSRAPRAAPGNTRY